MSDLRTLAQAVVDARAAWLAVADAAPSRARAVHSDEWRAMLTAEGNLRCAVHDTTTSVCADVLLAALDAVDAQGYARAMWEVVERADHSADYTGWSDYALGHRDAHERLAVWARERLPAAAEKEHGG